MKAYFPTIPEVSREVIVVLAGALIAALIVGQLPGVKAWMQDQWGNTPR